MKKEEEREEYIMKEDKIEDKKEVDGGAGKKWLRMEEQKRDR